MSPAMMQSALGYVNARDIDREQASGLADLDAAGALRSRFGAAGQVSSSGQGPGRAPAPLSFRRDAP